MVFLSGGVRFPTVSTGGCGSTGLSTRFASKKAQTSSYRGPATSLPLHHNVDRTHNRLTGANATGPGLATLDNDPVLQGVRTPLEPSSEQIGTSAFDVVGLEKHWDAQSLAGNHPSSASPDQGLPEQLYRLQDPGAAVQLPALGTVHPGLLDNWKLDKLVCAVGRNKATWRRAMLLYEWLKDSGHDLDDRLCTTLIRVCADHSDAVSALAVYEWMRAPCEAGGAALKPTTFTYTAAMRAALGAGMLERAMQIWNDAQTAHLVPDCRLCITYVEACMRLNLTDKALQMYCQMRDAPPGSPMSPTVHAYTAAMRAASEGGRWHKALDIWDDMHKAGCLPTGHAYAAAISACAAGQDWMRAVQLFEDMTNRGIRPDVVSCTALITALAAAGEAEKAENVVKWMLSYGLKPNVRTFTALLTAFGNAKQWARAVEVLFQMQMPEWGAVQPNAYTYSALLKSLGEHGQWQLAEAVFAHLEQQLLPRSQRAGQMQQQQQMAYAAAAMASNGGSSRNWTSPSQLNGLSVDLSAVAINSNPVAAAAAGLGMFQPQTAPAFGVLPVAAINPENPMQHTMLQITGAQLSDQLSQLSSLNPSVPGPLLMPPPLAPPSRYSPGNHHSRHGPSGSPMDTRGMVNEVVCGALMLAFERAGRWAECVGVLGRARALGVVPNTVMFNTAISASGKAGQLELAEQLFSTVPHPDAVTHETLIAAYGMAGLPQKAEHVFRLMVKRGLRPRDYAYCGLVAAYSLCGDFESALRIRKRMRRDGVQPTVHVYNALLAACERSKHYDRALELLNSMKREGVEPNSVTQQLMAVVGRQGVQSVETQQVAAAALSAAFAAAGTLLMQTGVF